MIESVQRFFTRKIPCLQYMRYAERLRTLQIPSLERRRLHADLIFCYKILNGFVEGPPSSYGIVLSERQSRGHSQKLLVQHARVNVRKSYFSCRVSEPWNSLPESAINATSVFAFKKELFLCNLDKFLILGF